MCAFLVYRLCKRYCAKPYYGARPSLSFLPLTFLQCVKLCIVLRAALLYSVCCVYYSFHLCTHSLRAVFNYSFHLCTRSLCTVCVVFALCVLCLYVTIPYCVPCYCIPYQRYCTVLYARSTCAVLSFKKLPSHFSVSKKRKTTVIHIIGFSSEKFTF